MRYLQIDRRRSQWSCVAYCCCRSGVSRGVRHQGRGRGDGETGDRPRQRGRLRQGQAGVHGPRAANSSTATCTSSSSTRTASASCTARTRSWSARPTSTAVDVNGKEYGKDVQRIAAGPGTGWVSFMFKDPITGKVLPKENYVEKAGDYIYLAGVYTRVDRRSAPSVTCRSGRRCSSRRRRGWRRASRLPRRSGWARPRPRAGWPTVADKALPTAAASAQLLDAVDTIQATAMRAMVWQQAGVPRRRSTRSARTSNAS